MNIKTIGQFVSFAAMGAALLTGCQGDGDNPAKIRQLIVDTYKTTEIFETPKKWRYIVRGRDGTIYYVEALSIDAKLTAEVVIFTPTINKDLPPPMKLTAKPTAQ